MCCWCFIWVLYWMVGVCGYCYWVVGCVSFCCDVGFEFGEREERGGILVSW